MEKWQNLPYLLAAYSVVWIGFFVYLVRLVFVQRRLERRLEELEAEADRSPVG